ncbi:DUF6153 family protein [Amycolatopsis regifaucium]|uniref:Uncharacterized protein n=1 Tax=Amycolatopsis regifaucium TaxID=546365 RepID=A0A154MNZ4_9PSEU|nr:DUF6153 family protein [Amycolatopsis regifaucium]KZB85790.1 hypothetical protein AVL48_30555 [Amycolatopsis regifaucium]OKA10454.1 hypothetical protein ATP06_0203350 [Amycolatopsis regifaucium]SFI77819.1 hypothetical protein SAMN04489731_11340 [Amycolatopsis regifaucium]
MTQSAYPAALRWLLLCVVALGLVGMHHVIAESGHGAGHETSAFAMADPCCPDTPSHDDGDGGHSGLHLCLAVLAAAVLLIITWLLVRSGRTGATWRARSASGSASGRDPPRWRPVPERLSFLCVLRV